MFDPPLALASLSGRSDATWARAGLPYVGCAFMGGIAICPETREAARAMVARDREEFLPDDPIAFIERNFRTLQETPLRPAINVRSVERAPLVQIAECCRAYDAILEINAHCRQEEMCAVGAGETLLEDLDALTSAVEAAAGCGPDVSVKVRAEIPSIDLGETASRLEAAGASAIHVDAMDTPDAIAEVVDASELYVIANNGVRDAGTTRQYLDRGADAVSIGRAWDRPPVLAAVARTIEDDRATIDRKPSPR